MNDAEWLVHKGKRILYVNLRDIDLQQPGIVDEVRRVLAKARELVDREEPKSVRIATDISESGFTVETNMLMEQFARKNTPFVKASAVVGATGLRKIVTGSFRVLLRRELRTFDDLEQAKEWLVTF